MGTVIFIWNFIIVPAAIAIAITGLFIALLILFLTTPGG